MRFTRDSLVWSVSFVAAVLTFLAADFNMLHMAFPWLNVIVEAQIKFGAALCGFITGYLRMSPLALSQEHPLATRAAGVTLSPVNSSTVTGTAT